MCQSMGKDIKIQRHAPLTGELQQRHPQYLASDHKFAQWLPVLVAELENSYDFIPENTGVKVC